VGAAPVGGVVTAVVPGGAAGIRVVGGAVSPVPVPPVVASVVLAVPVAVVAVGPLVPAGVTVAVGPPVPAGVTVAVSPVVPVGLRVLRSRGFRGRALVRVLG
jgi:hypothetical protein